MAGKQFRLSESLEDYLEIILDLEKTHKVARTKDIANKMGVQQGTVTGALKSLGEKELINYQPYSFITLTPKGEKMAREVARRHDVLKDFLFRVLQINVKKADTIACRMEHAMDKASVDKLVQFIDFIDNCPRTGNDWVQAFMNYCATDNMDEIDCEACLSSCTKQFH